MGLGAPKRRNKLSTDPNNTAWTRSTSNFGHKILSQQGWQPGQFLGAENANHSDHYTAANASHIRIALREDNLGLGAKVGGNKAETFGLSLFSGVLGRLNGKDDAQVQKQQDELRDAELRQYQVGKYGLMNFVSGGLLVGDKMEEPGRKVTERAGEIAKDDADVTSRGKKRKAEEEESGNHKAEAKKKKRRQAEGGDEDSAVKPSRGDDAAVLQKSRRKDKKGKDSKQSAEQPDAEDSNAVSEKKAKKRKRKADNMENSSVDPSADEKARLKQEKRARKEDRRRRKEEKRLKKAKHESSSKPKTAKHESKPTQAVHGGRHAVRHRYIQQKRMAGMDAQAMKEIFMVKAAA